MINRALTLKQILAVPCPTCGADRNKSCEPTSHELGAENTESDGGPHLTNAYATK